MMTIFPQVLAIIQSLLFTQRCRDNFIENKELTSILNTSWSGSPMSLAYSLPQAGRCIYSYFIDKKGTNFAKSGPTQWKQVKLVVTIVALTVHWNSPTQNTEVSSLSFRDASQQVLRVLNCK